MNSNQYWKDRIKQEIIYKLEDDRTLLESYQQLYDYHFNNIKKEIESFFMRYGDSQGISSKEVKQRVDDFDVELFAQTAKRMVAEKDFSPHANEQLKLYNLKMRVNRLELLNYYLDLEMVALSDGEYQLTNRYLNDEIVREFHTQSGILGLAVPPPEEIERMTQAIKDTPFKGATWSDRIWDRQDLLRDLVERKVHDSLIKGNNGLEWVSEIRKMFGVGAYEAKRLSITELARAQTAVQKETYKYNDFDRYIYLAEPTACSICARLHDKVFEVEDMTPGENAAPMHPHCRCSTAPDAEGEREKLEKMVGQLQMEAIGDDNSNKSLEVNLQLFGRSHTDRFNLEEMFNSGSIEREIYKSREKEFKRAFAEGVDSPLGKVYARNDTYQHIISRHSKDFFTEKGIVQIIETVKDPDTIIETSDALGRHGVSFISYKGLSGKALMVIDRNGIITAYGPGKRYLERQIKEGNVIYVKDDTP